MYIYTIRSKSNDREIYIGSTKNSVRRRQTLHKSACKQEKITPLYEHINRNGGWNNYYCELYEEFSGTLDELKKREGELIRQFKNDSSMICLNPNIAGRTPLENLNEKYKTNSEYRKHCLEKSKKQYEKLKSSLNPPLAKLEDQIQIVLLVLLAAYALHHSNLSKQVRLK